MKSGVSVENHLRLKEVRLLHFKIYIDINNCNFNVDFGLVQHVGFLLVKVSLNHYLGI
jgi:hypothetical protein